MDLSTGMAILAGGLNFGGGLAANESNARNVDRSNQASLESSYAQMNFQERMSNSAYQRSMADMKAAGLNPMLAYQQGGASSPAGAS